MRVLRLCNVLLSLYFIFVEYSSDKRSKEIGPSSLKDSGERVVLILFFCSTDLPH